MREVGSSERARALQRDLREFGSHVVGDDDARTRVLAPSDDEDSNDGSDAETSRGRGGDLGGPGAKDAMRLAESFASGAWAALGGAASKAREALEKADVDKARSVGIGALGALKNVVKATADVAVRATADVLAGEDSADEEEEARLALLERLDEFGLGEVRTSIDRASDAARAALARSCVKEADIVRVRESVRRWEEHITTSAEAPSAGKPSSPGVEATLVAVPLDDDEEDAERAAQVESAAKTLTSLIGFVDARAEDMTSSLARYAEKKVSERHGAAAVVEALEDGLDTIYQEFARDGLAKLTVSALRAIEEIIESIERGEDARWVVRDDATRVATRARNIVAKWESDIEVFAHAVKEALLSVATAVEDATRDSWPMSAPEPSAVAQVSTAALDRDRATCVGIHRDAAMQLAWIIESAASLTSDS
ncbi:hypothetical protein BE221DRAFT_191184 [Ostreococcus tauri]|uniref:Uncharacterized protein n=1 Tax=Ostreococcus tauri TaxID=70448 RepID=A0A1Y5IHE8_OSTTA|nr:hypothetical protein BE221DRAFT_191184 [Ostreococcus tauri]